MHRCALVAVASFRAPSGAWRSGAGAGNVATDTGSETFSQHIAPETEQLGGSSARRRGEAARPLHETALLHQTAEVLLVQSRSRQGLHRALEREQREGLRQKLENDRSIADLATQAAERRG